MKKNLLKFPILLASVGITLLGGMNCLEAAALNNKTSFSVGTDYKKNFLSREIDTTADAKYAFGSYNWMGWSSVYDVEPTVSSMKKKHSNGYYYLESSIVFFSGHGNQQMMGWNYKEKGGNYSVGVINRDYDGTVNTTRGTYNTIGLGRFNLSQNDLVVFAGCETARDLDNITTYVVKKGAKTAIGWTPEINSGAHTEWLKAFHEKLKTNNSSVSEAAIAASSASYTDNRVKSYYIAGNKNNIPSHNFMIARTNLYNIKQIADNEYVLNKKVEQSQIEEQINQYITKNIDSNFNPLDYKIEINGNDEIYYDYVLYVDGIRTNLGYTIVIKDNKILSIYDNTDKEQIASVKNVILTTAKAKSVDLSKMKEREDNIKQKTISENLDSQVEVENSILYYDTKENKLYQVTSIKLIDELGMKYILEDFVEL